MNSFTGSGSHRPQSSSSSSFDSYQFDFGIASRISSSSRPLKDQKLNPNSAAPKPAAPSAAPSPPARPSWTPNPSPSPSPSMAGDIFGRTWSSSPSSKLGMPDKNPNLFADLLGPAIGSARASTQNIPLKSAPPPNNPSFSMADLKSSVPNPTKSADPFGSLMGFSSNAPSAIKPQKRDDPLNVFFSPSSASTTTVETKTMPEMDDWDVSDGFGGEGSGGATTELEGLPPPPVGVTASAARVRGLDNYKQGQFADAIKWLSWAFVLLEKSGGVADEVLICRASCYKEVGEYKKAIADCSKVLEHDSTNVSVLLQRALLYESSEKYRLGAEDLRAVLKIDPGNRLARSTIHRMNQFAD